MAETPSIQPAFGLRGSRQFTSWLREIGGSLAFSTYQSGKLFLLGLQPDGKFSVFERTLERVMGLCASPDAQTLWVATLWQLWRFENIVPPGQSPDGYDRVYVPQSASTTGDIDAHDIAPDKEGHPVFVNTLFSCLSRPSETHSFRPVWKPPWISRLAAEDRCHLNGLAMRDGRPAFVTAVSTSDVHEGWREHRRDGGVVADVASGEIVTRGLSMPHSPRWHQGQLFLLESGTGHFGRIDLKSGRFEPVAFCPGYARGLALLGNYAIVGLSTCRENRTFSGLALDEALAERGITARCGLIVIDLRTGDVAHSLSIEGVVRELYDVAVLPGVTRPSLIGFKGEAIRRTLSIQE